MYAWISTIGYPPRQVFGSDQVPSAASSWGGGNYMDFHDAKMDADILTAETSLDPAQQRAAWTDMQHIYADQLPSLPLFFRADAYVLPIWLKGVVPTGHLDASSLWAEFWHEG